MVAPVPLDCAVVWMVAPVPLDCAVVCYCCGYYEVSLNQCAFETFEIQDSQSYARREVSVLNLTHNPEFPEHVQAEFGWPIEVKGGCVAKISIDIPWTSLYYDPVLIHVEEILILAGPAVDRKFDPERDKRLMRAAKKSKLESTDISQDVDTIDKPQGFTENLATAIVNNVQVSIQNVHIRYEDTVSNNSPFACGLVLQNLTAITTNNKWKPTQIDSDAKNIFKLLKVESFSLYWNPSCPANTLVKAQLNSNGWKTLLRKGLATFSINGEDFDFILKPVSLKVKVILNKSKEAKVPKLLLDFVLQDAASQLSRDQFISIYMLSKSFDMMAVNQRYRKYYSGTSVKGHAKEWWQYAYRSIVNEYIKPYTWSRILEHRKTYRKYKTLYKECLQRPNDTELKLDLQLEEDKLDVTNILLAREEAKKEIIKEQPNKVKKVPLAKSYWSSWFDNDYDEGDGDPPEENLVIIGEKKKSWWARMTNEEKERLYEGIGFEVDSSGTSIPPHYIAHKLNFTLANCTLSLMNCNHEILVVTVTHFLSSIETRPGAKAFKLSARTESFVVEGASVENDLVPVLTADSITSGSSVPHVFSLDFEKSPLQVKAKYGLTVAAEPMEIVYHRYAVSELLAFLQLPKISFDYVKQVIAEKMQVFAEEGKASVIEALRKRKTVHISIDLKSPYFVIPEHGSLQQGGSVLVLDMGRLTVNTDLQADPSLHEEATKMEAEERLYDRFNISLSDIQVLFADSGDEWRVAKQVPESDIHLFPKTRIQVTFSNSVKPDYRILPRQKLNISVPALKLNLSDRRVSMVMEFIQNLPLPETPKALVLPSRDTVDAVMHTSESDEDLCMHTILEPSVKELKCLRRLLNSQQVDGKRKNTVSSSDSSALGQLERYYSASDHSDDESEEWARVVDLPGFDDNVSPSNSINVLLRFIVGEVSVHLSRSSDHSDKPYLMLRAEKLCIDVALMEYGPALQASLSRIQLVDKLHTGSSGEYLELVSSTGKTDMITILYRKVQANCPDFKSHFHQVEHSLVLDLATVKIAFHREAFMTLGRFLQYVSAKLRPRFSGMKVISLDSLPNPGILVFQDSNDPPIPPGATKFSISARMNAVTMRLCDTDLDLADLKVAGLECDYVLKANEKSVLRLDLTELSIEDLMEQTLYSKVLSTEDDSVFDIKFVKNSPHHHKEIDGNQDSLPMKVDGSIRVRFGRMIVVLVQSFMNELQRFWEPFLHPETTANVRKSTEGKLQQQVFDLQKNGLRFQLSIDIHAPTLLLPQKPTSPNALIVSLGDLSVENFFQEVQAPGNTQHYVDNILVRLNSLQISRAVILIDSKMEIREPILEPLKLRLDIKRALSPYHKEILLYEISGSMDIIKVNIGQRDLSTIIAIYQDNYSQMKIFDTRKPVTSPMSPINSATPTTEDSMKKLEVFLYTSADIYKETSFAFIMEGMHVTLYTDGEELHSSPVRDPNQALSMFELDEVSLSFESFNDKSMELRCSCQAATLLDLRAAKTSALKKIFQSYSGYSQKTGVAGISLSMPPMVDLIYRQTGSGDAAVDVVIEKIRLNVSVCYLLAILKFVSDALPGKHMNGILCDAVSFSECKDKSDFNIQHHRLPSDSTSGYHSNASGPEDSKGLSISAVLRKPEIILFADPMNINSEVVVLKMDVMFDYSFNLGQANYVMSFSGLHMLSCVYGRRKQTMCIVLHPCEAEFTKTQNASAEESKMVASLSSINLCLSAPVTHTIIDVVQELMKNIQDVVAQKKSLLDNRIGQNQDLWSPMNVTPQKWMENKNSLPMKTYMTPKFSESLTISVPDLQVMYEIPGAVKRIPVLYAKCSAESEIGDWSHQINMKGEIKLEVMYFNEKISTWEPLLEHVMINEGNYRAIEFMFKVFRDRSYPIWCPHNDKDRAFCSDVVDRGCHLLSGETTASSSSSGNETEEEDMMTIIKRHKPTRLKRLSSIAKSHDSSSLLAYPPDSDSENEDGMLEKIASTFDHLFSDEGSDENPSDSEGIADVDTKSDSGETETADNDESTDHSVFMMSVKSQNADDDEVDNPVVSDTAVYVTVDCRDHINVNITPTAISVMQEIISDFTSKKANRIHPGSSQTDKSLVLKNFLGPESVAKALKKGKDDTYETVEEASGKMTSTSVNKDHDLVMPLVDISPPDSDSEMAGDEADGFHISSALLSHKKLTLVGNNLYREKEVSELYKESTKEKLSLEVDGFDKLVCFIPARTTTSMYALHPAKNKTRYYVLVGTELYHGQKTVTVYSPLKVKNHLQHPVHLLCQKSILEALGAVPADYSKNPFQDKYIRLTTLDVDQVYNIPLLVAYHCKLFVQPVLPALEKYEYTLSDEGIWWQDITVSQRNSKFLLCRDSQNEERKFCVKVVCIENKEVKTPAAGTRLIPNYILHLYPPVVVHNVMPFSTILYLKHSGQQLKLDEGENVSIFHLNPYLTHEVAIEVVQYLGIQWHGKLQLSGDLEEHHPILMMPETDTEGGNRHLSISVQIAKDRSMDIFLFCPYWVINKTGLPLQFRGSSSDVIYEIMAGTDPVLFRFKKHRRKKAKLRVYSSLWSHSFSLDTVGNHGIATCIDKERNKKYRFFVSIQMSKLLLTKIVVIKPYLLVLNNTENHLRFMEKNDSTDLWFDIAPKKCLPFWPDTDSMKMFVKQRDSNIVSQNFPVNKPHSTVLRMDHGSALRVEVKGGEDMPATVSFNAYIQGDAPVRVENLCEDLFLKIHQKCQGQVTLLSPYQSVLYTWDDPTQERTLIWNLYNRKKPGFPAQIFKDGYGHEKVTFHSLRRKLPSNSTKSPDESSSDDDDSEFEDLTLLPKKTRKDKVVVYWISYIENFQRVLLFTQDDRIAREARKAVGGENSSVESFLSLNRVGISLISASYEELAYLSLSSCPAIWEIEINHTWKLLTLELSAWLEDKWQNDQQKAQLKDYLQVDLGKMHMIKPFFGQLRRFYSPAVWCQLRKSKYQLYAHMKLHRFQIDNQLPDAIFPTVIHPGPTPQPVVKRSGPKPFIECGILLHKSHDQSTKTVKYFKLLMQELHLKLDKGFLLSLYDMCTEFQDSVDEERKLKDDIKSSQAPIYTCKECEPSTDRIVFEYVHFSPLKIHFSFSPRGTVHKVKPDPWSLHSDILDVLLNSVGATISEMKDVELRMAFFEKSGIVSTVDELLAEIGSHYQSQLVQQSYVLILGLDILGNPYGLVRDFTKGLGDFFYEPFLGSVKSPDEFADSLAKGAQSLLGHVIGGSAGAVSLLTGSLGQTLSVLTFDEEYRKKRQLYMQQHPASLPVTLLSAAKGFVLGIALGLSGVVVKPLTGAQQEGVEGFFRGVGKGLLGLITKPAGGVMDMVSMAFDGIRRAAEMGENVVARIRLPRFINPTMGLRPYSPYQASGCQLLQHISKGHYADTDIYWAHASLSKEDRSDVSLVTDKHMFLLEKCRFWGGWDIEWVISIDDIMTVPHINGTKMVIKVKQDDSVLSFAGDERYIQCEDFQVLEWLKDKIEKVLLFNMKEKPCPVDV